MVDFTEAHIDENHDYNPDSGREEQRQQIDFGANGGEGRIPEGMEEHRDGEETEEAGIGEEIGRYALIALGRNGHGGTGDGRPGDMSAGRQEAAEKEGVHHGFPSTGKEEIHGIAGRLEGSETGTHGGSDEQSAQDGGPLQVLHEIVDNDGLTEFLDDTDAEGAEKIEFLHPEDGEEEERGHEGGTAADEEDAHHLIETDVAVGIDLEKENHRGEGHREGADDDESGEGVGVAKEGAAQPEQSGGQKECEENAAIEPGMGPVARNVLHVGRRQAGAADEDVLGLFTAMGLEDVGEKHLPVEISGLIVAHIVIEFINKGGIFFVGSAFRIGGLGRSPVTGSVADIFATVGAISLPVLDRATTKTTIFHNSLVI